MKKSKFTFLILPFFLISLTACQAAVETTPASVDPDSTQLVAAADTQSPEVAPTLEEQGEATATTTLTAETPVAETPAEEPVAASGSLPDPATVQWIEVLRDLRQPVYVGSAGDGSGRLFILLQTGQILVAREGEAQEEPFLDISDRTTQGGSLGERGLLGLAFHPDFADNGYFYVNYTDDIGDTHISRFSRSADNPDSADPGSELELLFQEQPYRNHNGGALTFGPDGMLYIGLGDGGSGGDPQGNGQSLQTLLGKVLRIDVDGGSPYTIPQDNPFASGGGLGEIWAYGLRNPWRMTFDAQTGDLFIADVGQNMYEEINFLPADSSGGENYGWDFREGSHPFEGTPGEAVQLVDPVAEYSHEQGCSVTGGVVYLGQDLPEWQGVYLYGDYCSGLIWGLRRNAGGSWQNELLFESGFTITSFGTDDSGEVYVVDYGQGVVYRLEAK